MKKNILIIFSLLILICTLVGCGELDTTNDVVDPNVEQAKKYSIGDLVILGEYEYNVCTIDSGEIFLLAKEKLGNAQYSNITQYTIAHGNELRELGINIEYVFLLDYERLDALGGNKHSVTISGQPYLCDDAPEFVHFEETYWLRGDSKYETYTWVYDNGKILHTQYKEYEYAVRPVVCIKATEIPEQSANQ